ncbi:MAG: dTDP-4-dehydrorhamnose 3,5-epimerase [Nitrospinae bacterium]|nr:dTDP-4-dehydrorhamnose 3,5-epimerase [Nitrospinota bacterium]
MKVIPTAIDGVVIVEPDVYGDARGFFMESFSEKRYRAAGIDHSFVQDNLSRSARGVLRGLHFQWRHPQGKLVSALEGEVYDVCVDVRVGSPTFGKNVGAILSAANRRQLFIPPGITPHPGMEAEKDEDRQFDGDHRPDGGVKE